jgi:hypothetical protein
MGLRKPVKDTLTLPVERLALRARWLNTSFPEEEYTALAASDHCKFKARGNLGIAAS